MKIGINALKLYDSQDYRNAGISRYIRQLVTHVLTEDSENHYTVFVNQLIPAWRERTPRVPRLITTRLPTAHALPRIFWEQTLLPWYAARDTLDVLHCPLNVVPLGARCPTVLTIHDLAFLRFPHYFPGWRQRYLALFTRLSARKARIIVTDSASTRSDVLHFCHVPEERVHVLYPAADEDFHPRPAEEVAAFRAARGLPEHYVLYVGTLEPRKQVDLLVRAFAEAVARYRLPHILALVGGTGWMTERVETAITETGVAERVWRPGYVPREELPLWYNGADLFMYPSVYEGFGYPVLEALASGAPVVAAAAASLPEIVGEAGILVPPGTVEPLVEALGRALCDRALAEELRQQGRERARSFSWQASARRCIQLYQQAVVAQG